MEEARTLRRFASDFASVVAALLLCPAAAALAPSSPGAPLLRARALAVVERAIGLHVEPGIPAWTAAHPMLLDALDLIYIWVHLPAVIGVLVWVWLERRSAFARVRDTFLVAQALTIATYIAFPTAPPWMLARRGGGHAAVGGLAYVLQSRYAAIPSGHIVFALIAGGALVALARPLAVRVLGLLYPPFVLFVVVATGNHLWIDAAAGGAVTGVGVGVAGARVRALLGRRQRARRPAPRIARGVPGLHPPRGPADTVEW